MAPAVIGARRRVGVDDVARSGVYHQHHGVVIAKQAFVTLFRGEQCVLRSAFFRLIAENQHDAGQRAAGIEMEAPLSAMGASRPSLAMSRVWFANPTTTLRATWRGFSTGWRVSSLMMRKISSSGLPRLVQRPAGEFLRNRVEQFGAPFGVGHYGSVADAEQYGVVALRLPAALSQFGRVSGSEAFRFAPIACDRPRSPRRARPGSDSK